MWGPLDKTDERLRRETPVDPPSTRIKDELPALSPLIQSSTSATPTPRRLPSIDAYGSLPSYRASRPRPVAPHTRLTLNKSHSLPHFAPLGSFPDEQTRDVSQSGPAQTSRIPRRNLLDSPSSFSCDYDTRMPGLKQRSKSASVFDASARRMHPYTFSGRRGTDALRSETWPSMIQDPPSDTLTATSAQEGLRSSNYFSEAQRSPQSMIPREPRNTRDPHWWYNANAPVDYFVPSHSPQWSTSLSYRRHIPTYEADRDSDHVAVHNGGIFSAPISNNATPPFLPRRQLTCPDGVSSRSSGYTSISHESKGVSEERRRFNTSTPNVNTSKQENDSVQTVISGRLQPKPGQTKPEITEQPPVQKRGGKLPKHVTDMLKTWLLDHADHPYPTEEEKRTFCEYTGLDICQISNWFVNARRRILAPQSNASAAGAPSS